MFIKENEYKYFTSYMKLCVWRVNPGKLRSERDLNPGLFGNKPKLCLWTIGLIIVTGTCLYLCV